TSPLCSPVLPPVFSYTATAPPPLSTLSLHDALPICSLLRSPPREHRGSLRDSPSRREPPSRAAFGRTGHTTAHQHRWRAGAGRRSEEHTSELQSPYDLVCRLLLEKKKQQQTHEMWGN